MLIGIVGKPNVGKSTFFKAATLAEAEISNRPFTTIKPNEGTGYTRVDCPETFFKTKCNPRQGFCIKGQRFVPVRLLDVAGLVPGASEGKGLGNQFLDDLRQADALIHVIDASGSTDENGKPVSPGTYNPARDILFLETELDAWFFSLLKKSWHKFIKQTELEKREPEKAIANQFSGLNINLTIVKSAITAAGLQNKPAFNWSDIDLKSFASQLRRLGKPMLIAANKIDTQQGQKNIQKLKAQFPEYKIIPCSAEAELALREAAKKELIEYAPGDDKFTIVKKEKITDKQINALNFISDFLKQTKSTGVQQCINATVFDSLKYIVVFPGGIHKLGDSQGRILPDAFLFPPNSTALDFANRIHSDLAAGFIKALDVKTKKPVGKDYILKSGDVIEIVSRN